MTKVAFKDAPIGALIYDSNEDALFIKIVDTVYYASEEDEGRWINAIPIRQFSYPDGKEYAIGIGGPAVFNEEAIVVVVENTCIHRPEKKNG